MKYISQILLAMLCSVGAQASETKVELLPLISADVRHGQLANGLRYFIKANAEPSGKVEMRLLVNVGSLSEQEDERGLAHLLEHMAFRRTKHFGQGQVKAFIESEGMRLGNDTNAFTSHETTLYQLGVAKPQADRALQLLADWAGGIEFDAAEFATEKNVVLDEGRQGDAVSSFYRQLMNTVYPADKYAERMPIGNGSSVGYISLPQVKAFYEREYQAQRMVVMLAGDINPDEIEKRIKVLFSGVKAGTLAAEYPVPAVTQQRRIFTNRFVPGLAEPRVGWTWVLPVESMADADAAVRDLNYELLGILLQQRLTEQSRQPSSVMRMAYGGLNHGSLAARQSEFSVGAAIKDGEMTEAIREIYRELERAQQFGFSQQEVENAFAIRNAGQLEKMDHASWVNQMLNHVRYGESLRALAQYPEQRKRLFAATSPRKLQAQLQDLMKWPDQIVFVLSPGAVHLKGYFLQEQLQEIVQSVQAEKLRPNQAANVGQKSLMKTLPVAGDIVSSANNPATGGVQYRLSNGIELLLVPKKNATEQIGFAAQASGGLLDLAPKVSKEAGRLLNQYLFHAGLGELSLSEVNEYLALHPASLNSSIETGRTALLGGANKGELETLLQLQYLAFTSRRDNPAVIEDRIDAAYQAAKANENGVDMYLNFQRYGSNWPMPADWSRNQFDASLANLNLAREHFFGNPAKFKFVLTGVANDDKTRELIKRYIASLPTKPVSELKLKPLPSEPVEEFMLSWEKHNAERRLYAYLPVSVNLQNATTANALAELLRMRLWHALRETAGDTYGVFAWADVNESYGVAVKVAYQTDIKQCQATAEIVKNELSRLLASPPSEAEAKDVRDRLAKWYGELPQNPSTYAALLSSNWLLNHGVLPEKAPDFAVYTPEVLHQYAKDWLKPAYWTAGSYECKDKFNFAALK